MPSFKVNGSNTTIKSTPTPPPKSKNNFKVTDNSATKKSVVSKKVEEKIQSVEIPKKEITPSTDHRKEEVSNPVSTNGTFAPIRRKMSRDTERKINEVIEETTKDKIIALDKEGLNTFMNSIVDILSEEFVHRSEVESIVQKTLQKMALGK